MSKTSKRPAIELPSAKENKLLVAAAKADPDAQQLTPKQLKAMVTIHAVRGRPKNSNDRHPA